ncbi:hypothetical protein D3C77_283120 [compost metagenome]
MMFARRVQQLERRAAPLHHNSEASSFAISNRLAPSTGSLSGRIQTIIPLQSSKYPNLITNHYIKMNRPRQ